MVFGQQTFLKMAEQSDFAKSGLQSRIIAMGYLKKSPPEEKLHRRWRTRWFVLREIKASSFELTYVLEYYEDSMKAQWTEARPISKG